MQYIQYVSIVIYLMKIKYKRGDITYKFVVIFGVKRFKQKWIINQYTIQKLCVPVYEIKKYFV